MKYFLIGAFILMFSSLKSQTQKDATDSAELNLKLSESKMERLYKSVLSKYSDDTLFIKEFKSAQKAWQIYYKSQVNAMFPDYLPNRYGSMFFVCEAKYAKDLVNLRIKEMQAWILGSKDDDCPSSIKSKQDLNKIK